MSHCIVLIFGCPNAIFKNFLATIKSRPNGSIGCYPAQHIGRSVSDLLNKLLRRSSQGTDANAACDTRNSANDIKAPELRRLAITVASLLLFAVPITKAATPADPIEVKLRYVVLLSTFIRGNTADLSACMLSEPLSNPSLESLASKLKYIDTTEDLSACKSLFIPSTYTGDKEALIEASSDQAVLIISDHEEVCDLADVFLFQNGKRIFFHIDIKAIKQKTFSLAAQVLALSKKHKCERGNK